MINAAALGEALDALQAAMEDTLDASLEALALEIEVEYDSALYRARRKVLKTLATHISLLTLLAD